MKLVSIVCRITTHEDWLTQRVDMNEELPTGLPEEKVGESGYIDKAAAITFQTTVPPEVERYHISFANYNENKCCVPGLSKENAKSVVNIIKDIGINFKKHAGINPRCQISQIVNAPPYQDYYKGLPQEIIDGQEVREIKYEDDRREVWLRIYYYSIDSTPISVFYLIAISDKHENLNHKSPEQKTKKHARSHYRRR